MGFALEFGSGAGCALFGREGGGVEAVGVGLSGGVFRLQAALWSKRGGSLGLIVKPASRGDQHKDNDQDYGEIVRPAATFIGPENGADNASP